MEFDSGNTSAGTPVVKLYEQGNTVSGALAFFDNQTTQSRDYTTEELETWADGSPKMLTELYLLVDAADGAYTDKDRTETVDGGDLVRIIVRGSTWFQWKDALEAYKEAGHRLSTDMHVKWTFEGTEPSSNPKYGPKNIRSFVLTHKGGGAALHAAADTKSGEIAEQVQERRQAIRNEPAATATTFDNEEPF